MTNDPLLGRQTIINGRVYTVIEVDRTCYHPNHSPDNPWIVMQDHAGNKQIGCLYTIAPELAV